MTRGLDVTKLSDERLRYIIDDHIARGATHRLLYAAARDEHDRRHPMPLNRDHSIAYIWRAAKDRRFVSYGELAAASGADDTHARPFMARHLWEIAAHGHDRGWPILPAIVANKVFADPNALAVFTGIAKALGFDVSDPDALLRNHQEACWAWAWIVRPKSDDPGLPPGTRDNWDKWDTIELDGDFFDRGR